MNRYLLLALTHAALAGCVAGAFDAGAGGPPGSGGARADAGGAGGRGAGDAGQGDGPGGASEVASPTPSEVVFQPAAGTFVGTQMVALASAEPGAVIHYTTDGSLPTRASPIYRAPLALRETTLIRALAVVAGADRPVAAGVYVRLGDDAAAFSSNLPVVVLHTHESGQLRLESVPHVNGSVLVIEPGAGKRASLRGAASFAGRAGVRVHGNSSRTFPQVSYAFELRAGGSDDDSGASFLGFAPDADFVLVAPSYMDRSLVRTAFAFALSNEIGQYAPRARLVEAFVVDDGGPATAAHYQGVFALVEKIKRGEQRVPVAKLPADAQSGAALTGGYIFRMDHGAEDFQAGGLDFGFVYPDADEMNQPARQVQRDYLQGQLEGFFAAIAAPDFKDPSTGKPYTAFIDVPSFIDNNLINGLLKNVDAFRFSTYFFKERGQPIKAGPLWDVDRSSGTPYDYGLRAASATEWARGDAANPLTYAYWGRLFADPVFKATHARRYAELVRGPFAPAHLTALVDRYAEEVREAAPRHFARWPEMPPQMGSHAAEVMLLKNWLTSRVAWMTSQLPPP